MAPSPSTTQPVILDGGFSRLLTSLGAPFAQPEWSALSLLSGPPAHSLIKQAHTQFICAGAGIITTNSYAIVPFHIGEERFRERGGELAELAGRLCREAVGEATGKQKGVRVAGSLPPVFGSYEPALFDASRVQEYLSVLVGGLAPWVDLWLGETLSLIAEAEAVREAVRRTGKEVWIAFTLDDRNGVPGERGVRLRGGESVAKAAEKVARWDDVQVILFNCSRPEYMLEAVREAKAVFDKEGCEKFIGVYANRFEPQGEEYKANTDISTLREDLGAEKYVDFAKSWVEAGAGVVGGCCGVGEEYIRKLAYEVGGQRMGAVVS